jgi:hypothetical protein
VTVPLIVIAAFAIAHFTGSGSPSSTQSAGPLPALTLSAPPHATSEAGACTKVLEQLPVQLQRLDPRIVHPRPDTPFVVAWGDPPVVLRCGVDRPKDLTPASGADYILGGNRAGPFYDVQRTGDANVWTTVDRAAYISITVPAKYAAGPLPPLSRAIAQALPAVCAVAGADPTAPTKDLCTHR